MAFRLMKIQGPVIWVLLFTLQELGQVYKLRSPSARYLISLSTHDFSNLTKDWGFPQLPFDNQIQTLISVPNGNSEAKLVKGVRVHKDLPSLPDQVGASKNHGGSAYRGRAAERIALLGGLGVGPGQMRSAVLNISFGAGRYA